MIRQAGSGCSPIHYDLGFFLITGWVVKFAHKPFGRGPGLLPLSLEGTATICAVRTCFDWG